VLLTLIQSPNLSATIDSFGAQLTAIRDADGRDLQWSGDPSIWKGKAPILFPIVGAVADDTYRVDGRPYSLPRHGFARTLLFTRLEVNASSALFRLRSDAKTFKVYPFHFELDISFSLDGPSLNILAVIRNLDPWLSLPASLGFHPALRWPLPYGALREEHALRFGNEEPSPIRRLDAHGLVLPEKFASPIKNRKLLLNDNLFNDDAIIFDRVRSRSLLYGAKTGPQLKIDWPDTPYLGLWSKPGAGFICIEPWHGIADPVGFSGDFRSKPGIFLVPPAGTKDCRMSISLSPANAN
jgi:galactose mutarotase-like enzyme